MQYTAIAIGYKILLDNRHVTVGLRSVTVTIMKMSMINPRRACAARVTVVN